MTTITLICLGVYLVGAYVTAFAVGYFDSPPSGAVFWPIAVAAFVVVAALMPFIWLAMWLYNAGSALRGAAK